MAVASVRVARFQRRRRSTGRDSFHDLAYDDRATIRRLNGVNTTVAAHQNWHKTILKGRIAPGQYADFAVLNADYFTVPEHQIKTIESLLTVVGGKVVYAAKPFDALGEGLTPPPLPPVSPAWSPVAHFGGYQNQKQSAAGAE